MILAGLGILIGAGAAWFLATELTDALNPVAIVILEFPITSGIFLYGFLPTLLFQATIGMNVRRMADDWVPILVLAIVAVVLATLSSATRSTGRRTCRSWPASCSARSSRPRTPRRWSRSFRSIAAPQRLARIVEGESLLNDAAAIALYGIFIGFVMRGVPDPDLVTALLDFPVILAGGAVTGWILARLTGLLLALLAPFATAQITATIALPYLAFIIAEQIVGASGVIATVTAGLTMSIVGPGRLAPAVWTQLRDTWDLLAHWSGAFIFVLAAILIPRLLSTLAPMKLAFSASSSWPQPSRASPFSGPPAHAQLLPPVAPGREYLPRRHPLGRVARRGDAGPCPLSHRKTPSSPQKSAASSACSPPASSSSPLSPRAPRSALSSRASALTDSRPSTRPSPIRSSPPHCRACARRSPPPPKTTA